MRCDHVWLWELWEWLFFLLHGGLKREGERKGGGERKGSSALNPSNRKLYLIDEATGSQAMPFLRSYYRGKTYKRLRPRLLRLMDSCPPHTQKTFHLTSFVFSPFCVSTSFILHMHFPSILLLLLLHFFIPKRSKVYFLKFLLLSLIHHVIGCIEDWS